MLAINVLVVQALLPVNPIALLLTLASRERERPLRMVANDSNNGRGGSCTLAAHT